MSLAEWATEIDQEIGFQDRWNLNGFHHADISAPNFAVLTRDDFLIEIEGFVPGLLPRAGSIDPNIFSRPQSVQTEVGETHRVFGKHLEGGTVMVSILDLDNQLNDLTVVDKVLLETANKFGSNIVQALKINTREVDSRVDYAILEAGGEIEFAVGNPPLKLQRELELPNVENTRWIDSGQKRFLVYQKPILDGNLKPAGEIDVVKDFTAERQALRETGRFSLWLGLGSWLVAVVLLLVPILRYEFEKRSLEISLEEALQKGEGQSIEFKTSINDEDIAKLIAAFANSNPGNIFVGVHDNGGVIGLPQETLQQRDALIRRVQQIIKRMVQPPVLPAVTFLPYDGKTVLRLFVPKGDQPLYVVQGAVWVRRLAEVVSADRQEIIDRAVRSG